MKTRSGYETDGKYLKWKSAYTSQWAVETEKEIVYFKTEQEADNYIKKKI